MPEKRWVKLPFCLFFSTESEEVNWIHCGKQAKQDFGLQLFFMLVKRLADRLVLGRHVQLLGSGLKAVDLLKLKGVI